MTGHNSDLKAIAERANNLMDEKERAAEDLKELFIEAKAAGHDVAALKKAIARQREDADKRKKRLELEEMVATYTAALGDLASTELGRASIARIQTAG